MMIQFSHTWPVAFIKTAETSLVFSSVRKHNCFYIAWNSVAKWAENKGVYKKIRIHPVSSHIFERMHDNLISKFRMPLLNSHSIGLQCRTLLFMLYSADVILTAASFYEVRIQTGAPDEFLWDHWHHETRIPELSCNVVCVILRLAVSVEHCRATIEWHSSI